MKTLVFILLLGQAGNFDPNVWQAACAPGGLTAVPGFYESIGACNSAGLTAIRNNSALSFLSYTCVPAQRSSLP